MFGKGDTSESSALEAALKNAASGGRGSASGGASRTYPEVHRKCEEIGGAAAVASRSPCCSIGRAFPFRSRKREDDVPVAEQGVVEWMADGQEEMNALVSGILRKRHACLD